MATDPYQTRKAIISSGLNYPINTNQMNNAKSNFSALNQGSKFSVLPKQAMTSNNAYQIPQPLSRQPQINQFNNKKRSFSALGSQAPKKPNTKNSLLNYLGSAGGRGMAQGLLEASGYSNTPVSFGQALAQGMARGNEAEASAVTSQLAKDQFTFQKEQFEEVKAQNAVSNFLSSKKLDIDMQNLLKPQLSSFTKSLIQAGIDPSSPQGVAMLEAELTKAANTITIDQKGEGKYSEERGTYAAKQLNKMEDDAESAYTNLQNYEMIANLLPAFESGALSEGVIGFSNIAKRFGLDITFGQDIAAGEAIRSLTGSLVMDTLAKFKGAISDGERAFAKEINLGLGLSRKGNEMLIDINSRIYNRQIVKADMAVKWEDKYGSLRKKDGNDKSWNISWKNYMDENPLFDDEFKKQIVSQSNVRDEKYTDGIQIIKNSDGVDEEFIMNNGQLYKIKKVETK
tara:strand:+ start:67 stop:1434 length:1368 start_codon:yes stop_codon:yes gene_type:complete